MRWILVLVLCVLSFVAGLFFAGSDAGADLRAGVAEQSEKAAGVVLGAAVRRAGGAVRTQVLAENPSIVAAVARGGSFGGENSIPIATNMFGRHAEEAIEDAKAKVKIVELAPRSWLIRLPIVNAVLFETDEGLVLVDTGMAPAGPAILQAIREVSDKPLHTIIYTHAHVDHAYGTWALMEGEQKPQVIAHEKAVERFERYIRLRGSLARCMSQPEEQLPATREDLVWPTRTFSDRLELTIGGESFHLVHHAGETDDQLYVWVPSRSALASADYYQGFLPNAGNGKRMQRDVEEWVVALREMSALEPQVLLPAHGEGITDPATIQESFGVLAEALESIIEQTIAGLNEGLRKDQVWGRVALPAHLANHPTLRVQYVTVQDISKMVIRKYTGWWDDIPSHWTPSSMQLQARTLVEMAGGMETLVAQARSLAETDVQLACHFADWAFLADPDHPAAQQLVLDVYKNRITDGRSNTQEILAYVDHMTDARRRQLERE